MPSKRDCAGCDALTSVEYHISDELKEQLVLLSECSSSLRRTVDDLKLLSAEVKELRKELNKLKIDLAAKDGEALAYRRIGITGAAAGGGSIVVWIGQLLGWWGHR